MTGFHTIVFNSEIAVACGDAMYWLPEWEDRMEKYLARVLYVLTESQIFSHSALPLIQ